MAREPITNDELDRLRELHGEGRSCRDIARTLGRSFSTVSKYAREMGLAFDIAGTAQATEVRVTANRARRAELETRFLDEAAALLDQLHEPHLVYNFGGKDNTYAQQELAEPDVAAKATLVRAAGVAVDKAIKLSETDKATAEADAGKSMVGALFAGFVATVPPDPAAEPADDEDDDE